MNDPTYSDSEQMAENDHMVSARSHIISLKEARSNPSFSKAITLFDKWRALPEAIPHHKNITPTLIGADILPELYIIDVIGSKKEGIDFRWRLFGTEHSNRYGREATGILLSKAAKSDPSAADSYEIAQQVMKTSEATFFQTEFMEDDTTTQITRTVVMPLSDDTGNVSRLFGCSSWSRL